MGGVYGEAGATVVVEELLDGDEVSLLALCHGETARPLAAAQDFKRIGEGDTGPNTGGMGAYSPVPWFDDAATAEAARQVHEPLLAELARRGIPFSGCLYAGLMLTADGPRVLEYNVRFGDPETQALVARIDGDLAAALAAIAHGAPGDVDLDVSDDAAVTLVLAAPGYPEAPRTGQPIEGIERAEALAGVSVQHAGTALRDGRLVVAGGRTLGVTATAPTLHLARERAMAGALEIEFDGKQVRGDIALRAAQEEARV